MQYWPNFEDPKIRSRSGETVALSILMIFEIKI
jgi:hypothetical protein